MRLINTDCYQNEFALQICVDILGDKFAAYAEEDELEDEVEGEEDGEEGVVEEEGGVEEDLDEDGGDKNVHKVGGIHRYNYFLLRIKDKLEYMDVAQHFKL